MQEQASIKLGNRVRALRIERKLTQEKLAAMCDISIRSLADIEHGIGNPTYHVIASFLRVFRVSADLFFCPELAEQDAHIKELIANYMACTNEQKDLFFQFIKFTAQLTKEKKS